MLWIFALTIFATNVEIRVPAERRSPFTGPVYERALKLDVAGNVGAALELYVLAALQEPENAARAEYHIKLSRAILKLEFVGRPLTPDDDLSLGVQYANKFSALKRETGRRIKRVYDRAEAALKRAMSAMPAEANPVLCLAGLYAENDDLERARKTFALVRGRPLSPNDRYNLACYHYSAGEITLALDTLRALFREIGPKDRRHYSDWILKSDDFHTLHDDDRLLAIINAPEAHDRTPLKRVRP
jgi:tetratricopeptide (TPR) repeat protein